MPTVRQQRALGRADQDLAQTMQSFWYCYELSLPPWPCATACASASRPTTSRGHRRVERAAKVALPRLFLFSLLLQTRAPGSPTTSDVCAFWGVLDVVAGFSRCSASRRPIRRGPVILLHLQSPGRQSQIVQQEFHCTRQRRNRRGTSRVVSTTLHDRKNASAATRGNKSCILRPREAAAAPGRGARACSGKAMRSQPAPRAGTTR